MECVTAVRTGISNHRPLRRSHYASTALNRAGVLQSLLAAFLCDGRTPSLDTLEVEKRDTGAWAALPDVRTAVDNSAYLEAVLAAHAAALAKDWEQVRGLATAACRDYPKGELAWFLLGWSTLMLQSPGEAIPALAVSLLLGEHKPEQRYLLGMALRKLGLPAAAATHQKQVARRWPDFGRAYFDLALMAEGQGNLREALTLLQQATACEPRRPLFRTKLQAIRKRLVVASATG